jgi:predicted nucleotidyltransferase component of viral defense system
VKISKQKLLREVAATAFRPEILEKVWYLMDLLDAINDHSFLKEKLVLKGGTALNLFMFDLPRLSVDIDLNYIGAIEKDVMMAERPLVEQALEAVFKREELVTYRIPGKHAGGKWQLKYESVLGGFGNLEVDLNFMFRVPLCDIQKRHSHFIGAKQTHKLAYFICMS